MRSVFATSLLAVSAMAMHNAQEKVAVPMNTHGYELEVWAVTGKATLESQNIDTWFFGLELTTPLGSAVTSPDAKSDELDTVDGLTYVGSNGEVLYTYAQFTVPNATSGSDFESFSCSKMLTVVRESKEFTFTGEDGYPATMNADVTTEMVGEAMIQNYVGDRNLSDTSVQNTYAYDNQLVKYSNQVPNNQVDNGVWSANQVINSTVFLQQGYKSGDSTRKYNCVGQRDLSNNDSLIKNLEAGQTELTLVAGYKAFASNVATVTSSDAVSATMTIMVMDGAMILASGAVLAASSVLAF